ncbi:MAG: hypothetical protein COY80_01275, partial [Candidatus Pacebacteria bacterium CG_4_10_14_0_8_um_filter_42_14]
IGTTSPTAILHLKAGTTTLAPLKLTSGTNLTTPQTGAFEYDGAELYFTPVGTTRETVAYVSDITAAAHNPVTLAVIGSTPNSYGMTISGSQVLNLEPASASFGGVVTTGAQTLAGAKTLNALLTTVGISNSTTAISNSAGYTQSGTSANTFSGTSTFSNATYSALFTGGNVGVGTTGPGFKLQVLGAGDSWAGFKTHFSVYDSSAVAADIGGAINLGGTYTGTTQTSWAGIRGGKENATDGNYAGYLGFFTRPNGNNIAERMRISSTGGLSFGDSTYLTANPGAGSAIIQGNVGIGTTAPGAKLQVDDDTDVTLNSGGSFILGSTAGSSVRMDANEIAAFTSGNQTGAILYLQNDAGSVNLGASALTVANAGNVTVGNNLIVSGLTASLPVKTNASKQLISGAINLASAEVTGTLGPTNGGTGQSTYATGDLLYASAANTLAKRAIGSTNQVLTVVGGVPTWAAPGAAGSVALSSITAATGTNTIDSLNFAQTWNWSTASTQSPMTLTANALTTGSLLSLTSSNASINSTNGLLYVANTSAGTNGIVARIQSNSTAGSGLTVRADGNVGIGTTVPTQKLSVLGNIQTVADTTNLESELVTNGTFISDVSGWTNSGFTTFAWQTGTMHIAQAGAGYNNVYQNTVTLIPGELYYYSIDATFNSGTALFFQQGPNTTILTMSSSGTKTGTFIASSDSANTIRFKANNAALDWNLDNISIKKVSNGNIIARGLILGGASANGGSTGIKILDNGNVGIGTNNPSGNLNVYGNNPIIRLTESANSNSSFLQQLDNANGAALRIYDGTSYSTYFKGGNIGIGSTAPGAALDILPTTRTGVTINAANNYWGAILYGGATAGQSLGMHIQAGTNASDTALNVVNKANSMSMLKVRGDGVVTMAGSVGIGTTSPNTNLSIYNSNESTTLTNFTQSLTNAGLNIITDYTNSAYTPGVFWSTQDNNGTKPKAGIWLLEDGNGTDLYFGTSNGYATGITNTGLILDQTGNVGVGTTNPGYLLHIAKNGSAGGLAIERTDGSPSIITLLNVGAQALFNYTGNSYGWSASGSERMRLTAAGGLALGSSYVATEPGSGNMIIQGNLGIGTTAPTSLLHVGSQSNTTAELTINSEYQGSGFTGSSVLNFASGSLNRWRQRTIQKGAGSYSFDLAFERLSNTVGPVYTESMRINESGNVGINIAAPTAKLHVNGDFKLQTGTNVNGIVTTIANPGLDTNLATEKAIRTAIEAGGSSGGGWTDDGSMVRLTTIGDNVGIGTTDPGAYKLNVNGNTNITGTLTTTDILTSPSFSATGYNRITSPGGAQYVTSTPTVNGAIAVVLPVAMGNQMIRMTIKVYEYTTNESFEIHVGGYMYPTGNTWANSPFAYIVGNPNTDRRYTVRLGYTAGGKAVVYIGELTSSWSYPQVYVTDVQVGYAGYSSALANGWSIGFQSSAFENVTASITNPQVGFQSTANTANSVVLRDGSGNFAAGAITSGLINGQTISSAANFTGTATIATSLTVPTVTTAGTLNLSATGANQINFNTNGVLEWSVLSGGQLQGNGASTIQTSTGDLTLATAAGNGHIILSPNGTGNVGIGTTNPMTKLNIEGGTDTALATANSGYMIIGNPAGQHISMDDNEIMSKATGTTAGTLNFQVEGGTSSFGGPITAGTYNSQTITSAANFTGTLTTAGDLTVNGGDIAINNNNGGINFNDASAYWIKTATNWGLYWDTSTNQMIWRGSGTDRASIDLDNGSGYFAGNVGIGTSNPQGTLHVSGDSYSHDLIINQPINTNLTPNPSVEVDGSGWSYWNNSGSGTAVVSSDDAKFGSKSWKSTMTVSGSQGNQIGGTSVSGSTQYSVSAWVNIASWGGSNFTFYMREYYPTSNSQCGSTMYTASGLTSGWIRISGTCTTRSDTTALYISYYINNTAQIIYADGVQIEQSSSTTPYSDGSLGPGYTWSGAPHTSSTVRTPGANMLYQSINSANGIGSASRGTAPTLRLEQDGTGPIMQAFKIGTEVFTIANNGNVGIGTTGPGAKLEVGGQVKI